jgi:hypothetical protein
MVKKSFTFRTKETFYSKRNIRDKFKKTYVFLLVLHTQSTAQLREKKETAKRII